MFSVCCIGLIWLGLWRLWLPLSGHKAKAVFKHGGPQLAGPSQLAFP